MQLARRGSALSFPFSTFPKEFEEREGASADAWLDPVLWAGFEAALVARILEASCLHTKFAGHFVGTAMNHRAAMFAGIAEQPIGAAAAVHALRLALPQYVFSLSLRRSHKLVLVMWLT